MAGSEAGPALQDSSSQYTTPLDPALSATVDGPPKLGRQINSIHYFMKMKSDSVCYPILLSKIPGVETTRETVARHVEYLRNLDQQGVLVLAGPFEDFPGGMVIVRADSITSARAIAEEDPFVIERVRTFEVRTWLLATTANGYLG